MHLSDRDVPAPCQTPRVRIVYSSFDGSYSDNPRAVHQRLTGCGSLDHVWLAGRQQADSFPADVDTVPMDSDEAVAALESADLVIANDPDVDEGAVLRGG